jgi:hypothetical protein
MEQKIKKTPKYKVSGYKEEIYHVTSDGQEFKNLKDAEKWQIKIDFEANNNRILKSIKKINCDDLSFFDGERWYFIENQEQLDYLKWTSDFDGQYDYNYYYGEWKIGEWVTWKYIDGGDYRGKSYFYTFSFVKKEIDIFLANFQDKI